MTSSTRRIGIAALALASVTAAPLFIATSAAASGPTPAVAPAPQAAPAVMYATYAGRVGATSVRFGIERMYSTGAFYGRIIVGNNIARMSGYVLDDSIHVQWGGAGTGIARGAIDGTISPDGLTITGTLTQGTRVRPIVLTHV